MTDEAAYLPRGCAYRSIEPVALREEKDVLQKRLLFLLIVQIVKERTSAVFVIMAIDAEVFPVRAVRRIIFGISILVMYREKMAVFVVELTCTFRTN